ncbi:MAG: histidinol-phosphate transaminase [Candidatus Margulisbacteria bacterium]|nr:histidinol-phosphate transaminase [Candidatus Margulisiibacteriota bacterium]
MLKLNENIAKIHPYIPGKPIEEVQRELGLKKVVKLASNENSWGLPENVIKILQQKIKDLYLYPDGSVFRLRQVLADKFSLKPEQFIFGNGSDELLQLIALTYLNVDKEVIISEGTFSEYKFSTLLVNAPYKVVPLKNYTYDLDGFLQKITAKTSVIFICNPNNPTGTYFTAGEFDKFIRKVPEDVLVVLDEAYYEYASGTDYPESCAYLKNYKNLIILRTFSKIWSCAGLRLGFGIADEVIINSLNKARQPFNVNALVQDAALTMLQEKEWEDDIRKKIEEQKKYLYTELKKSGLEFLPSRSNFIFIIFKQEGQQIFEELLKKGVIVRPMKGFGFPNAIRVTVGLPEENQIFIKSLNEVLKCLSI